MGIGDATSEAARDEGGGRPGGAARPGGTTGERPGGTAGMPGGAAGTSLVRGTGDCGEATSGAPEPESESTATEDVGERGGGGGGGAVAVSFALDAFVVAGVTGRFGRDAGVAGREEACEDAFAAAFLRTSVIAGAGLVVEPDRCCRAVGPARRAFLDRLTALELLCRAVLARLALLLLAHDAARGRPIIKQ